MTQTPTPPRRPGQRRRRAPNGQPRYLQINVMLPPGLVAELDRYVEAEDLESRSELVRRACEAFMRKAARRAAREDDTDA